MLDILFIIVVLFVLSFSIYLSTNLYFSVASSLNQSDSIGNTSKSIINNYGGKMTNIFDNTFVFVFIGLILAVGVGAFLIRSHPAFFFISLGLLVLFVMLGTIFSNLYGSVSSSSAFSPYVSSYVKMDYIMTHLPMLIVIAGILIMIVMYAKNNL